MTSDCAFETNAQNFVVSFVRACRVSGVRYVCKGPRVVLVRSSTATHTIVNSTSLPFAVCSRSDRWRFSRSPAHICETSAATTASSSTDPPARTHTRAFASRVRCRSLAHSSIRQQTAARSITPSSVAMNMFKSKHHKKVPIKAKAGGATSNEKVDKKPKVSTDGRDDERRTTDGARRARASGSATAKTSRKLGTHSMLITDYFIFCALWRWCDHCCGDIFANSALLRLTVRITPLRWISCDSFRDAIATPMRASTACCSWPTSSGIVTTRARSVCSSSSVRSGR